MMKWRFGNKWTTTLIPIRRQVWITWSQCSPSSFAKSDKICFYSTNRFYSTGYVTYGTDYDESGKQIFAKEALVFLVAGINEKFKLPVAYFLTAGVKAMEKAALIQQVTLWIGKSGAKVDGLVYDGLVTNIAAAKALGASFKNDKAYFNNPHSDDQIYLFPDVCHSLKSARNRLATKSTFYDSQNNKIEWRFIVELEKFQRENNVNLGNRLTKVHIQWEKKRMSVRIAAETLSNSVADAIEFLANKEIAAFQESEATVAFIRRINNVFDILNSKNSNDAIGFKRTISPQTKDEYFKYFDESIAYFKNLKLSPQGQSILKTQSKTVVIMTNFRLFYQSYVEGGTLEYVATFHFSQDHLELFFGCKYWFND